MNYEKIYENFIENRKMSQPNHEKDGKSELHHILPKSLGGTNSKENLIRLKTEEHIFAHMLLAKIYGGVMWGALKMMLNSQQSKITNKKNRILYLKSKEKQAEHNSKTRKGVKLNLSEEEQFRRSMCMRGSNNPMFGKTGVNSGRKWSSEVKSKQSISKLGEKNPMYGKTRKNHSENMKNSGNPMYGKSHSKETLKKMSETLRGKPVVKCPHCDKIGKEGAMKRWHFDNCKKLQFQ